MVQSVVEFRKRQKVIRKKSKRVIKQVIALRKTKRKALRQRAKRTIITKRAISTRVEAGLIGPKRFAVQQLEGFLDSTAIKEFDFDPLTLTLKIQFWISRIKKGRVVSRKPGGIYIYFEVPSREYEGLLGASSKGRYFYYRIRGRYNFQRLG